MAKKETSKAASNEPKGKSSKKLVILLLICSLVMVAVFKLGFIFFMLAMLPSVVAFYVDISRDRMNSQTVFACNLAGALPYMTQMLEEGVSSSAIQQVMTSTTSWLVIYASAGFGWLLIICMPICAQYFINTMHQRQIARLQRLQSRIVDEWGQEVSRFKKQIASEPQ
jgi:hypothetical protein